jgi:hypothetical protein
MGNFTNFFVDNNHNRTVYLEALGVSAFTYFVATKLTNVPPVRAALFTFSMMTITNAITPAFNRCLPSNDPNSVVAIGRNLAKIVVAFGMSKGVCNLFNQSLTNTQIVFAGGVTYVVYLIMVKLYKDFFPKGLGQMEPQSPQKS